MKRFLLYSWLLTGIFLASLPVLAQTAPILPSSNLSFWAQHPVLSSLLAGTVGVVLGAWVVKRWSRKHYHHIIHQVRLKAREEAEYASSFKKVNTVKPPTDYELKLRKENEALKAQIQDLMQQLTNVHSKSSVVPVPAAEPALTVAPPQAAAQNDSIEAMLGIADSSPEADVASSVFEAPSIIRYAPVQETGFLRDNKLATDPLPQLPLLLTLDADGADKAIFTLSPHVNQAKLIGDGLHQLSEFFDFDLPTGRIIAVSADAPGQLTRQGDGWQVVRRARLLVH